MRPSVREHLRSSGPRYVCQGRARRTLRPHGRTRALQAIAATATLLVSSATVPAGAQARTSCAYAGAPTNVLTVTVSGESDAVITRRGQEITVGESGEAIERCAGATATVTNTDTINVVFSGRGLPFAEVRLANGPLAPGASVESEGAPEIEVQVSGPGNNFDVIGTPGADVFRWGPGGANPGLNLNPDDNGDRDVDVTVLGGSTAPLLYAEGGAGNDTITGDRITRDGYVYAHGGPGNDVLTAPPGSVGAILYGGPGNDAITGSRFNDVLRGDAGNDRIAGGAGADNITGGAGRDRITGGAGRDFIKVRDAARDAVSCGSGRDRVNADKRDRVSGCEKTSRR